MNAKPFDITPSPRILRVLGDITVAQWRCLAELIDNSIDAFNAAGRRSEAAFDRQVSIAIPRQDTDEARIVVRDNGPGMDALQLENAVRAGWTSNDPFGNLGLFGMGFNIATARLGSVTEVWTSRRGDIEETGIRIDLFELQRSKNFTVAQLKRAKSNSSKHGTEISISRLKPDQRQWFARGASISLIRRELARCYAPIIENSPGKPGLLIEVNGQRLAPKRLCAWGKDRAVDLANGERVFAVQHFDVPLSPRRLCFMCGQQPSEQEGDKPADCPNAGVGCNVQNTQRRIHGWIGIQRYLHATDFGIDLIRNGRKIEMGNKELFNYVSSGNQIVEYPIDDPRGRGRIVGEVHIDHVRVTYTKDRFEREDPAWEEMVRVVRGDAPLQPNKARDLGLPPNLSPLSRIFQAFRRTSPQGKNGRWSKILCVKNNDLAIEMAEKFDRFDHDFQGDDRWFQVVEGQDEEALVGTGNSTGSTGQNPSLPGGLPAGILDLPHGPQSRTPEERPAETFELSRQRVPELSREYAHPVFRARYAVETFRVSQLDPELVSGEPWRLKILDPATQSYGFFVNANHPVFSSSTLTPIDALMAELSHRAMDLLESQQVSGASFASALTGFRKQYCVATSLDARELVARAQQALEKIAIALLLESTPQQRESAFSSLSDEERRSIGRAMVARGVSNQKAVVEAGEFLTYADAKILQKVFESDPAALLDGKFWDESFRTLDYGTEAVTQEARIARREKYSGLISDAGWLASQTSSELERAPKAQVQRAALALELLQPDST